MTDVDKDAMIAGLRGYIEASIARERRLVTVARALIPSSDNFLACGDVEDAIRSCEFQYQPPIFKQDGMQFCGMCQRGAKHWKHIDHTFECEFGSLRLTIRKCK